MMFYVGQKVVCLMGQWDCPEGILYPVKDREYVIRSIIQDDGLVGLRLHWLINPPLCRGSEQGFATHRRDGTPNFRPVIETDIAIFERIARDVTERRKITEQA